MYEKRSFPGHGKQVWTGLNFSNKLHKKVLFVRFNEICFERFFSAEDADYIIGKDEDRKLYAFYTEYTSQCTGSIVVFLSFFPMLFFKRYRNI